MTGLTAETLKAALPRIAAAAAAAADDLNARDGAFGDGDLGVTVSNGWAEAAREAAALPADLGAAFLALAKAHQRASSSSFGTLTATALMAAAKAGKGREAIPWSETAALLAAARDAMLARGKGELGRKSVLDAVDAAAKAAEGLDDPAALRAAVQGAAEAALSTYRDRPAGLGRARMFGERTVGADDPGMVAFRAICRGLG
jgi:dihydroxyacetone kinase-like protein